MSATNHVTNDLYATIPPEVYATVPTLWTGKQDRVAPVTRPPVWLDSYAFTLTASVTQTFIGEIPGGFRIDLQYVPAGTVSFPFPSHLPTDLQQVLKPAVLLTGTDWVSVSNDGIATFDARVSLQVGPPTPNPDKRCVISATIHGRADLADCRKKDNTSLFQIKAPAKTVDRYDVISLWQQGFPDEAYLPLALSAVFDVPVKGNNPSQDQTYEKCRGLERAFFVAFGRATFRAGAKSPLASIRLDFVNVPIPLVAADTDARREQVKKHLEGPANAVDLEKTGGQS
jgi:hypothetical protein